jgi:hypothetical protein
MTYKTELPELGGAFDEPVPDPEPWTPEDKFNEMRSRIGNDFLHDCLTALYNMIESDRAEIGRLTETVNRQDRTFGEFVNITGGDFRNVAEQLDAIRQRLEAIESTVRRS